MHYDFILFIILLLPDYRVWLRGGYKVRAPFEILTNEHEKQR